MCIRNTKQRRARGAALAAFLIALACPNAGAANLLQNPAFEKVGADSVPEAWVREYDPVLGGPFQVVQDARAGANAVCLMTEEWNIDRPQFVTQRVALPPGSRALQLTARCRGQGTVRLALGFLRGGRPLATVTNQPYFGTYVLPVEAENVAGLGPEYRAYRLRAAVPAEADGVNVVIGNTKRMSNFNPWGTLLVAGAELALLDRLPPEDEPSPTPYELTRRARAPAGCRDIARYARIVTAPPCLNPQVLVDGEAEEPWQSETFFFCGTERHGAVMLRYPAAVVLSNLCVHLLGAPSHLRILGDTEGQGRYTETLAEVTGLTEPQDRWLTVALPARPVHGIRLEAVAGAGLAGWRTTRKWLNEVQLHMPAESLRESEPRLRRWPQNAAIRTFEPPKDIPWADLLPSDFRPAEDPKARRFGKEIWADLWMFGIPAAPFTDPAKADGPDIQSYIDAPAFQALCNGARRMGFDTVDVFLEGVPVVGGKSLAAWKSAVCENMRQDVLGAVIAGLHRAGLKTTVDIWSKYGPPFFSETPYLYPQEETSRYPRIRQYPSVIHGAYAREKWGAMMDEILATGTDDASLMWHEGFYKGHFMETFPKNDPGRDLYRRRFGRELPAHEEDSLAFRQWIVMRHEGIADLFGAWTRDLRRKHPRATLSAGTMMQVQSGCSYLTESGMPLDLMAERGGLDVIGTDYAGPDYMTMATAANGWRRVRMIHDANLWGPVSGGPKKPDFDSYAEVLRSAMYGVGVVSYYRYNYTIDNWSAPEIGRAMAMLKDLENLGVYEAKPCDDVAFFFSRASKDWWQIRAWWGERSRDPDFDRGAEGSRGWYTERAVFDALQENGIPLCGRYLDRAGTFDDLARHKVLVIPFAWAVSDAAAARIRAAVEGGALLLLADGMTGQTDEWGEPRATPAFTDLVASGRAVMLEGDRLAEGAHERFAAAAVAAVVKALGGNLPLRLNRNGNRIEATVLEKSDGGKFLFLLNYETRPARLDLGLPLPDGAYDVRVRDENQWLDLVLDGRRQATAADLAAFRFSMEPRKPYVFYVKRAMEGKPR